jgi:hypothetical protein
MFSKKYRSSDGINKCGAFYLGDNMHVFIILGDS